MISKLDLQSIISKYSLGGTIEDVMWEIEHNNLNIIFRAIGLAGKVSHSNFPLENSKFGIYNTTKLSKLISVTSGDLLLELEANHKIYTKLKVSDSNFNIQYPLADILQIPNVEPLPNLGPATLISTLDSEVISSIIKAKSATESNHANFKLSKNYDDEDVLVIILGDNSQFANKIEYAFQDTTFNEVPYNLDLPFNSDFIKTILQANKEADVATMSVYERGIIEFKFSGENWNSLYLVSRKADQ